MSINEYHFRRIEMTCNVGSVKQRRFFRVIKVNERKVCKHAIEKNATIDMRTYVQIENDMFTQTYKWTIIFLHRHTNRKSYAYTNVQMDNHMFTQTYKWTI